VIRNTGRFTNRKWGVYKLWLRYVLNVDNPRISFAKGFAYRFFLSKPDYVLDIVSGFCPICRRWFRNRRSMYYHLTWDGQCSRDLFKVFSSTFTCGLVDRGLVDLLFPHNVVAVYREYARLVIGSRMKFNKFDSPRMYINFFDLEKCDFKSIDVGYEYWYRREDLRVFVFGESGGGERDEFGQVQVQEVQ
jgi:hypothetical protein